ncbi:hypothetical protein BRC91_13205 [Halobacteriales archaeon QS_4_62_28]|nr:MAG: hypothetical protein BRC91_13205 [Halobacteriales archaeon QS_4_62_28]
MNSGSDSGPAVDDASNVLLVAPGVGDTADQLCGRLLAAADPVPEHVILVTVTGSPPATFASWRDRLDPTPSFSTLAVDCLSRSAASERAQSDGTAPVEYVDSTTPVRELGERLSAHLSEAEETAVCFDSITAFQTCMDRETTFEFLHVLGSRIRDSGATGYYYIDRTVHDEETLTLYAALFDAVVETGTEQDEFG